MESNFEVEFEKTSAGNNGSNMSLRNLVVRTEKAMHGMSSRFGDVNKLKGLLEELLVVLANQKEVLGKEVKVLGGNDVALKNSFEKEIGKLRESVNLDQKTTKAVNETLEKEIEEVKRLEKKFDEQLAKVEVVINRKLSRQRYLWSGVGVLVLSLVVCLGYMCNELKEVTKEVKRLQTNIDISMTEVKGAILIKEMEKASSEKTIMVSKGKKH